MNIYTANFKVIKWKYKRSLCLVVYNSEVQHFLASTLFLQTNSHLEPQYINKMDHVGSRGGRRLRLIDRKLRPTEVK